MIENKFYFLPFFIFNKRKKKRKEMIPTQTARWGKGIDARQALFDHTVCHHWLV